MTEKELREKVATWGNAYKGIAEGSTAHKELINIFNNSGLCTRYKMTVSDAWCAMFVSDAFIANDLTNIFPCVECGCSNMVTLAQSNGIWVENDSYVPDIGDVVMYDWDDSGVGDNTGNPDHVGIVQSVGAKTFDVIEGNKSDTVGVRTMSINGQYIRGFITPNYASVADTETDTDGKMTTEAEPKTIWDYLYGKIDNAYGVAGLMGNLYAESALIPINLQDSYESKLGYTDMTYTEAVDSGKYTKFSSDSAGYGLAQWTYSTRKKALLAYAQEKGVSVGYLGAQLAYLWNELKKDFPSVLSVLQNATSVQEASDAVLTKFEQPADQGTAVKEKRANYAQRYYDTYASGTTSGTPVGTKTVDELAQEVIAGQWGNDPARSASLKAAGYDAEAVQARVNELLSSGTTSASKDSSGVATAGKFENGYGSGKKYRVTAVNGLNLRYGPSESKYDIIRALPCGTYVTYYGYYDKDSSGDKWLLVIADGVTGWVHSGYVV